MSHGSTTGLASIPRLTFTDGPTPVQAMDRLARLLGKPAGTLLAKRDDLTALAAGGNKVRKLEYVVAEALVQQATCLVTGGGVQSNSARATAAAAAVYGLGCRLVLDGVEPPAVSGNLALDHILGAGVTYCHARDDAELEQEIRDEAARAEEGGERAYVVPIGASTPLGALGYVRAADELTAQVDDLGLVVVATGSAGTHAGLVAGLGDHSKVLGVRVGGRPALQSRVEQLAADAADLAGRPQPTGSCRLDEDHVGPGYGRPTSQCHRAIALVARTEGLILDPVYTGKAMAALIDLCRAGVIPREQTVVFLHTGGMPGLLAAGRAEACVEDV